MQTNRASDLLMTSAQLRTRFGNISDMTIHRWLKNEELSFPRPFYINGRRFWREAELDAFEARQASKPKAA